jgi:hypothetical protein
MAPWWPGSYDDGDISVVDEFVVLLGNKTNQQPQMMREFTRRRLDQDRAAGLTNFYRNPQNTAAVGGAPAVKLDGLAAPKLGFQRDTNRGDMWVFIGILFRAKRIKIELEPEIFVVSFGDELVQFVASAGARGRPGTWGPAKKKKKCEACDAGSCAAWVARARACARMLAGWSKAWLGLAWPAEFNLFFFFFLSNRFGSLN